MANRLYTPLFIIITILLKRSSVMCFLLASLSVLFLGLAPLTTAQGFTQDITQNDASPLLRFS